MPAGITVIHRVIAAIRIEIIRQQIAVGAEQGGIIGRDETAYRRVIVTRLQVVPSSFSIVIITAVTNGIDVGNADRSVIVRNGTSTPCVIVISCNGGSIGIVDADHVTLCVLAEEILRSRSGVGMVGEADDCAGCIVLIDEVTLRLIHSRCASLANQSAVSVTEIGGADSFSEEPGILLLGSSARSWCHLPFEGNLTSPACRKRSQCGATLNNRLL